MMFPKETPTQASLDQSVWAAQPLGGLQRPQSLVLHATSVACSVDLVLSLVLQSGQVIANVLRRWSFVWQSKKCHLYAIQARYLGHCTLLVHSSDQTRELILHHQVLSGPYESLLGAKHEHSHAASLPTTYLVLHVPKRFSSLVTSHHHRDAALLLDLANSIEQQ